MERAVKLFLKPCPRQYNEFNRYATVIKFLLFDYRLHVASVNISTLFLKNVKEERGTVEPRLSGLGGTRVNSPDNRESG